MLANDGSLTSGSSDLRFAIDHGPMRPFQILAILLCVVLNALDGYDVLSIAFVAPAIARLWHLEPQVLGLLLSAGPAGMAVGALLIAPLGDVLGRRRTIILCLVVLTLGMLLSSLTMEATSLGLLRILTGAGIGGMLANINVVSAEYASLRRRTLSVNMMAVGYPIGASVGGVAAVALIGRYGWHAVFLAGGVFSLLMIPVVLACLPESAAFLIAKQPHGALQVVNRIRRRLGLQEAANLDTRATSPRVWGPIVVLRSQFRTDAVLVAGAFFMTMTTVYFAFSWMPKILTQMGLHESVGLYATSVLNAAGIAGCISLGLLSSRLGLLGLASIVLLGTFITMGAFGVTSPAPVPVFILVAFAGFFLSAAIGALYSVIPAVFPAELRASGAGIALSIGRCGAIAGPFLAGYLLQHSISRGMLFLTLSIPTLLAVALLSASPALRRDGRTTSSKRFGQPSASL